MTEARCSECGRKLPTGAAGTECVTCLLSIGLSHDDREDGSDPQDVITSASEVSGQFIGRYRLIEVIGEGGFGVVWRAEQEVPVRRQVALKILKLGMDTRAVVARFEAERQALALMDHPNIARVFDGGATEAGRPYFVMELVCGQPITAFCDDRRLTTRERLELFITVCQAVQHAHQKGIIHRDLKPSNLLVLEQDGQAVPKVIDFGIARATEERLTDKTVITRQHQFLGTPAYMSPEQASLGGLDIDTRSDVYSLGVLLYELLTGGPPFDARQLGAAGAEAALRTIREQEPPRPSTRLTALKQDELTKLASRRHQNPQRFSRLIRGDLDWITLKALEKDRARRYQSATDLGADLRHYLGSEPIAARPPGTFYRLEKFARRNKLAFGAVSAVLAALVVGLVATSWQAVRARLAEQATRRRAYAAEVNAAFHAWQDDRMGRARELLDGQRPGAGGHAADLRGFDWRYLWKASRPAELYTLTNAANWGIALSPDGQTLAGCAVSSEDLAVNGRLRLWSLPQRREIATLSTNAGWMFALAFSPDGRHLAVPRSSGGETSRTNGFEIWDVAILRVIRELRLEQQPMGVAFSPDGRTLATTAGAMYSTNKPGEICLWNFQTGEKLWDRKDLPLWAYQVAFSPDGGLLATSGGDGVVRLWTVATGALVSTLAGHNGAVEPVTFSHDGKHLAAGDDHGYVWLWNLASRQPETIFKAHDRPIYSVEFSADDQRVLTGSRDFTARLWDRRTRRELARFAGHGGGVTTVRFLPGDQSVVTGSQHPHVKVWSTSPGAKDNILAHGTNRPGVRFTSGGRFLARINYDEQWITFFDPAAGGRPVKSLRGQEMASTKDGKWLAVLHQTDVIFLDPVQLDEIGRVRCETRLGGRPSFSPDGRWLAFRRAKSDSDSGHDAPTLAVIVDVAGRRVFKEIDTPDEYWGPVFFARDGRLLLTVRWFSQETRVWDTSDWRLFQILDGTPAQPDVVSLSPDGRTFALSGNDGRVRLWNLDQMQLEAVLNPNAGSVHSLAFDPEGTTLAVGTLGGAVQLWNIPARQEVVVLKGHRSSPLHLDFSPDGRALVSSGLDNEIRLWQAPSFEEIRAAESPGE